MATTTVNQSARLVTAQAHFYPTSPEQDRKHLFSVNAGVCAKDALEALSCFLVSAHDTVLDIAESDSKTGSAWAVCYVLNMCQGIVESLTMAIINEQRQGA